MSELYKGFKNNLGGNQNP